MIESVSDAQTALEADGLFVSKNNASSLLVGASVRCADDGLRIFKDTCALIEQGAGWVAVFPADGWMTYKVPGSLPDLVSLIRQVYSDFRTRGGQLSASVKEVVENPEQYLIGRSLASV